MTTVGNRIRDIRKKLNLTQGELAKKINVSAQVVSNWERGYTTPNAADIEMLAKALDVEPNFLYGFTDDPTIIEDKDLDDEYRKIERFARKVSPVDRKKALNILEAAFEEAFNEEDDDDDNEDF